MVYHIVFMFFTKVHLKRVPKCHLGTGIIIRQSVIGLIECIATKYQDVCTLHVHVLSQILTFSGVSAFD